MCKSLVEELEAAIAKVDPKKKIETGTFRLDGAGSQTKTLVSETNCFLLRSILGKRLEPVTWKAGRPGCGGGGEGLDPILLFLL